MSREFATDAFEFWVLELGADWCQPLRGGLSSLKMGFGICSAWDEALRHEAGAIWGWSGDFPHLAG